MRRGAVIASLVIVAVIVVLVAVASGAVRMPLREVTDILWLGSRGEVAPWPDSHRRILWSIRLPRVLLGFVVGAALAASGTVLQALFRNPMADPYVTGVSSGAALGAVLALLAEPAANVLPASASVPLSGFISSLLTLGAVLWLTRSHRRGGVLSITALLLIGVAVSSFISALVSLLVFFHPQQLAPIYFWLLGGLGRGDWNVLTWVGVYTLIGVTVLLVLARDMNALASGEETAFYLGLPVARLARLLLVVAALLTGATVAVSGMIGFVGLIVPHLLRLLVGPDHRLLLPASIIGGGTFLVFCDTIARTVISPQELPVGVVTALLGSPFFVWILRKWVTTGGAS